MFKPSSFNCVTTNFSSISRKKTQMVPPPISNFAYNSTYCAHCCSLAAIFRFPINHKQHVGSITWHDKHLFYITYNNRWMMYL
jgi:hypothetical protein